MVERPIVETHVEAKQGRWGVPVFVVLATAITLVVIAFAAIAFFRPA